jgi:hypothetical protein
VRNLGRVSDLNDAFPGGVKPVLNRGALQGEAVVAHFRPGSPDNYLFSLNAQSCVIASLYNPTTRVGAVIHFDHNIRPLIERSVTQVLERLGGTPQNIRATLVGGDWLSAGADIGGPVRRVLREQGLQPTWDYWSYSSCLGNSYGVVLNLNNGVSRVFKHSSGQIGRLYDPLIARSSYAKDGLSVRARHFTRRFTRRPLHENAAGAVVDDAGLRASATMIEQQAFSTVML